eukprot:Gb_02908 [translate_table: standard]
MHGRYCNAGEVVGEIDMVKGYLNPGFSLLQSYGKWFLRFALPKSIGSVVVRVCPTLDTQERVHCTAQTRVCCFKAKKQLQSGGFLAKALDAFDTEQLLDCMVKLKQGKSIDVPNYDFKHHQRSAIPIRKPGMMFGNRLKILSANMSYICTATVRNLEVTKKSATAKKNAGKTENIVVLKNSENTKGS